MADGRMLVFSGGEFSTGPISDTWILEGPDATAGEFGAGCSTTGQVPALHGTAAGLPRLGAAAELVLDDFAVALPFAILDVAPGSSSSVLDLGAIGLPGCSLYFDPMQGFVPEVVTLSAGAGRWRLSIPQDTHLLGVELVLQAFAVETAGQQPFHASAGVTLRLGS